MEATNHNSVGNASDTATNRNHRVPSPQQLLPTLLHMWLHAILNPVLLLSVHTIGPLEAVATCCVSCSQKVRLSAGSSRGRSSLQEEGVAGGPRVTAARCPQAHWETLWFPSLQLAGKAVVLLPLFLHEVPPPTGQKQWANGSRAATSHLQATAMLALFSL